MALDLKKLQYVVVTAESGSVSLAANKLHITQPALTRSIAQAEYEVGMPLFERLPRGMKLTKEGKLFVEKAKHILLEFDGLSSVLSERKELREGRIRLGFAPRSYVRKFGFTISSFAERFPSVSIEIFEGPVDTLAEQLSNDELDFVLGYENLLRKMPAFEIEPISEMCCLLVMRKDHPLAKKQHIEVVDVLKYPAIVPTTYVPSETTLAQLYRTYDLPPLQPKYLCDEMSVALQIVNVTDAYSINHHLHGRHGRLKKEFFVVEGGPDYPTPIFAVARKAGRKPSSIATHFIKLIKAELNLLS